MVMQRTIVSADEFDHLMTLPEHAERHFELIHGEMVEVVSNGYSSEIAALFVAVLFNWVQIHPLERVTGADGGYMVNGERYIPDAAYISKVKQPTRSYAAYNPLAPDLAVEVLSPGNTPAQIRTKVFNYIQAGTVVWLVDPDQQQVEVYAPGQPAQILGMTDTLEGGNLLSGFTLAINTIFPL
ncbi:MAG: Uma2 family endonuclease [Armatimonadetes bacterium]|nr:Uma2 family endonuclease [Anaerolineae bacterium]